MEPKMPSPDRGPEFSSPVPGSTGEVMPSPSEREAGISTSPERNERRVETSPPSQAADDTIIVLPVPSSVSSTDDTTALPPVQQDIPSTAKDSELIEKEWVDKAKRVIAETKDDPYRREQEVSKLQADYLLKRYGRKLGSPQ